MAPTKPLVKQQIEACYNITAIPKDATVELTGNYIFKLICKFYLKVEKFFLQMEKQLLSLVSSNFDNLVPESNTSLFSILRNIFIVPFIMAICCSRNFHGVLENVAGYSH